MGRRNYRSFLLFVFNSSILCIWVIAMCIVHIEMKYKDASAAGHSNPLREAAAQSGGALAVGAYTVIFLFFVGGLSLFHIYLVSTNQTTYENFRCAQGACTLGRPKLLERLVTESVCVTATGGLEYLCAVSAIMTRLTTI